MPRIGIAEKAFSKGQSYVTRLVDIDNSTVEAIADGNNTESGKACFSKLTESQLGAVVAAAMDMSPAFLAAANEVIPLAEAKIVHDRFHVMQHATEAVDKVRRREHRELKQEDDMRLEWYQGCLADEPGELDRRAVRTSGNHLLQWAGNREGVGLQRTPARPLVTAHGS